MNRLIDAFVGAGETTGDLVAPETDPAHLDLNDFAAFAHRGFHHTTWSFDGELVFAEASFLSHK